ncbi:MAG: hypothetical protein NTW86_03610, partial [Candidatus Sumerlaeota bacterium]|nr:hypothetical protein [Candidatus Sumerlaeota bacterium]
MSRRVRRCLGAALGMAFVALAGPKPGRAALVNPGLERNSQDPGAPDDWSVFGSPVYDRSGREAASGVAAARVSASDIYWQAFTPVPGSHYTFGGRFRSDVHSGAAHLYVQWAGGSQYLGGAHSPAFYVSNAYGPIYGSFLAPLGSTVGQFFPRALDWGLWVWEDDFEIYGEDFQNPGFEEAAGQPPLPVGWSIVGSPVFPALGQPIHSGAGAVGLADGDAVSQRLAVSTVAKRYALTFWARGEGGGAAAVARIDAFDSQGDPTAPEQTFPFLADDEYQRRRI